MYKQKNKATVEKSNFLYWLKRKVILISVAFMLGMSNAIYEDDKMLDANQNYTEQEQKKE